MWYLWLYGVHTIEISYKIEFPYKTSTCALKYTIDSALIYIMVVKIWNTIWPPPPQISLLGDGAENQFYWTTAFT
jgi:hypothetical protein